MNKIDNYDALYLSVFNRGLNLKYRKEILFNGLREYTHSNPRYNYVLKDSNILNLYKGDNNNPLIVIP